MFYTSSVDIIILRSCIFYFPHRIFIRIYTNNPRYTHTRIHTHKRIFRTDRHTDYIYIYIYWIIYITQQQFIIWYNIIIIIIICVIRYNISNKKKTHIIHILLYTRRTRRAVKNRKDLQRFAGSLHIVGFRRVFWPAPPSRASFKCSFSTQADVGHESPPQTTTHPPTHTHTHIHTHRSQ